MAPDIPGKYIHEKTGSHYIELKADGSYFLFDGSKGLTGTYQVIGSEITIFVGDSTSQGKIQDGIIIDDEGDKWLKLGASTQPRAAKRDAARTADPLDSMTWLPAVLRRDDFPWELIEAAGGLVLLIALFAAAFGQKP
jgi:hypothetical protein